MQNEATQHTIMIRPARLSDVKDFRELRLEALRSHPEAFSADYELNAGRPMSYWEERLSNLESKSETGMIYFAEHEERLIGMCGVHRDESPKTRHTGWIWGVYVADEWRGFRVAERLIEHCAGWAQAHGMTSIKLGVATNNGSAIRCYLRCGFTVYGVEPQAIYVGEKMIDELLMVRIIA